MGQTQEVTLPHSYPETAHALIRSSIHSLTPGDTTYNHKDRIRTFLYRRRLSAINAHQKGPAKEEKQKCLTRQPASLARSMALEHLKTPKRKRRSPFQVLRLFQQVDEPLIWCGRRDSNSHTLRRWNLNPVCLPIPPHPHFKLLKQRRQIINLASF